MTKSQKAVFFACGLITILFTLTFQAGCKDVNSEYIVRLDSLDQRIALTDKYLSIDYSTINSREQIITKHLIYMNKYYDQIMTEEFGNNLTKYKAIKKIYSNFLNRYGGFVKETQELKNQAADLRMSVDKNEISKDEFKQFYQAELNDINTNLEFAKHLYHSIHALEPEYQRISRIVSEEVVRIAAINTEFREVVTRDSMLQ